MDQNLNGVEEKFDRNCKVISGTPAVVDREVNRLWNDYTVISWNWAVVKDELTLSCICISNREIRKAQIANAGRR